VLTALGLKFALTGQHAHGVGAWCLFGGLALYLLSLSELRRRNVGSWNVQRAVTAAVLLVLAPLASHHSGLGQLAAAAVLLIALICFEVIRFAEMRAAMREHEPVNAEPRD
jgi:hypothetical protein